MPNCKCIEDIDALLPDHKLDVSIVFSGNTLVAETFTPLIRRDNGRPETRSKHPRIFKHKFCPFCGTDMKPAENSENGK